MRKSILLLFILLLLPNINRAQCAMCKAVAESSAATGAGTATGLNEGIVYLMAFPYLLMAAVAFAIYRHRKTKTSL